ncbi:hypothetical protein SAMN02745193_02302 [Erythrobacter sanguineus]|uniref:Uncharacterized protein n=1 Tax=Erythrobacter sanguineus TaxID=198312 RepID=A0A1M7SSP1_9SPHN|nr:hypothetical protein SAMN02745193_02302 [Erythrobacter sanguineus]
MDCAEVVVCAPAPAGTSSALLLRSAPGTFRASEAERPQAGHPTFGRMSEDFAARMGCGTQGISQITRSPGMIPNSFARPARSSSTAVANPTERTGASE